MFKPLWTAARLVLILTALTGAVYPAVVTAIAHVVFPARANGSLVRAADGRVVGSRLVGQAFEDPRYFWGRPSATGGHPYNAAASGGSNLGPTNPALTDAVQARVDALKAADPDNTAPIPVDLVTASGSGLDPDISPAAAAWQVGRVARSRGMPASAVSALVARQTEGRFLGLFGEPRVNVLQLNLALGRASP
ncbi:MAG: potassium-transporting ATPase subunit KdpC [Anaerolineae bacterium]